MDISSNVRIADTRFSLHKGKKTLEGIEEKKGDRQKSQSDLSASEYIVIISLLRLRERMLKITRIKLSIGEKQKAETWFIVSKILIFYR